MAAHYYTKMTMMELECISEMMTLIESRLETWLELPVDVECRFFDEHEEDNYVEGRLRIDGNEIYRVVEAHPLDAMDLISSWAIRNLILNCGNSSNRLPKRMLLLGMFKIQENKFRPTLRMLRLGLIH